MRTAGLSHCLGRRQGGVVDTKEWEALGTATVPHPRSIPVQDSLLQSVTRVLALFQSMTRFLALFHPWLAAKAGELMASVATALSAETAG